MPRLGASPLRVTARWGGLPAVAALGLLVCAPARAATLTGPISGWASGVPDYISMYEYVPDGQGDKAPVLVVAHYCGGTAAAMFGLVSGSGLVAAADRYGFIMIFPETSQGCWDVSSTKTLTRDGGGDTQAIAEMVSYELGKYGANPDRVYATGQSSGAMMTEALLAVYPDVFKAGAEFSGVPAGCANIWDGQGLCGEPPQTAQQWGDRVRAMYPGYAGHRPRIQLWHGTADTLINYNNQTEAIEEWTNVLGLSSNPTSTDMLSFNGHQWSRESWQDSCGYMVLDAWSEQDGPHNTDASENATYVIPFLGLDQTGPVDPWVERCASSGTSGSAGTSGAGGSGAAGITTGTGGSDGGVAPGSGGAGAGPISASAGAESDLAKGSASCGCRTASAGGQSAPLGVAVGLGLALVGRRRSRPSRRAVVWCPR